jgi:glyoxylase-like metal-dependent hydrolase (beta-lactamase superfamily II)
MAAFLCETCGTQYPEADAPPEGCPICEDERQYVGPRGQRWTTLGELARFHRNAWRAHPAGMLSIETQPAFAIGQRAFLLRTEAGNILWDCLPLIDAATEQLLAALGGVKAIAISHPHYYATMAEWAARLDCPVLLHEADRQWVMRHDARLQFWSGERHEILPGLTLICCGGHYPGGSVLHWARAGEAGVLFSGDILQVAADRRHVSVLRSYPNMLPVSGPAIERVERALAPFAYDQVWGAFTGREIVAGAKERVAVSLRRYLAAIRGDGSAELR